MKKICVVTNMHQAFDTRVFKKECVSLAKKYEVFLVAPNVENQIVSNVHIIGVKQSENRVKRLLSSKKLYPILCNINADAYHFHDPGLMGLGLKMKKKGKIIVFDSHEDAPETIKNKHWIPQFLRMPIYLLFTRYEKYALRKFDALISVTPSIVERLKKINHSTYQVTNYPIFQEIEDNREWGRAVCYTGGISKGWKIHNIVKAVNNTDVSFVLAGWATSENYLKAMQNCKGWGNVIFKGKIPYSEINNLIQSCSAAFAIHSFEDPNVGYTMGTLGNTKFFEYMMVGIPVITSSHTLWKEIIAKNHCGICVNPDNPEEIRNAILTIVNNPLKAKEMGDNGKEAVKKEYNWASQEKILLNIYDKLFSK